MPFFFSLPAPMQNLFKHYLKMWKNQPQGNFERGTDPQVLVSGTRSQALPSGTGGVKSALGPQSCPTVGRNRQVK